MSGTVLAIDAGQTAIKTRLVVDGRASDASFAGIRTHEPLLPQLTEVARRALGDHDECHTLTAGVSGLTTQTTDAATFRAAVGAHGHRDAPRTILAHDSVTSYLGALGATRGAVVAAGTGVVTLAVGGDAVARVDGWGSLIGDAGSGYWIGRAALDAVMRDFDGRGPRTRLREVAEALWPDLSEAYIALQSASDRVSSIASLARDVAELTIAGDAVASEITRVAAAELAHSVRTALLRVHRADDPVLRVCALGGVFHSAPLSEQFAGLLTGGELDVTLVEPSGTALDGALALATLAPSHPLARAVAIAV